MTMTTATAMITIIVIHAVRDIICFVVHLHESFQSIRYVIPQNLTQYTTTLWHSQHLTGVVS